MWKVHRHTRNDKDYANYKEALNAATTEIRQSKRSYERKLTVNIKLITRVFMHISRVKKNERDRVGPLEDSAGNIISHICVNSGRPKCVYQRGY